MNLNPFLDLIVTVLNLYGIVLLVWVIMSLLLAFNLINRYHPFVQKLSLVLFQLTEPILRPIRRFLPDLGNIDISPVIVFLLIQFINNVIRTYFYTY